MLNSNFFLTKFPLSSYVDALEYKSAYTALAEAIGLRQLAQPANSDALAL